MGKRKGTQKFHKRMKKEEKKVVNQLEKKKDVLVLSKPEERRQFINQLNGDDKFIANHNWRIDARNADDKRKSDYLKAISRLEEQKEQEENLL